MLYKKLTLLSLFTFTNTKQNNCFRDAKQLHSTNLSEHLESFGKIVKAVCGPNGSKVAFICNQVSKKQHSVHLMCFDFKQTSKINFRPVGK